jgi:hypothetical protein
LALQLPSFVHTRECALGGAFFLLLRHWVKLEGQN